MKLFKYFFSLSFALIVMYSCKPEFPSWETDTVFPLFDARLQISDFAGDTLITVGDDSLLSLYYEYSMSDFNFDSLLTDMDTIASYTYVSPFTITLAPGAQVLNKAEVSKLGLKDVYLKVLTISNGTINIRTSNKYLQPLSLIHI